MADTAAESGGPQNHRTVDRVTQILEEVVYQPGITFADLARALEAPKSSVHGFVRGLLAKGWLYEDDHKYFLGPAVYGLTLATGQITAGTVQQEDLQALHEAAGTSAFLGIQAGDHLIYVSVAGTDERTAFGARSNIRRDLLDTAGGKAILAERSDQERDAYLRRRGRRDAELVAQFLKELRDIRRTRVAENYRHAGSQYALAAVVRNQFGEIAAEITLVGDAADMEPRKDELRRILLAHIDGLNTVGGGRRASAS